MISPSVSIFLIDSLFILPKKAIFGFQGCRQHLNKNNRKTFEKVASTQKKDMRVTYTVPLASLRASGNGIFRKEYADIYPKSKPTFTQEISRHLPK